MIGIVLLGVMADRRALTLRTLALAALSVLLLTPEAVVHPSFQMSFAATLASIALRRVGNSFVARAVRPAGYDRPWAPAARAEGQAKGGGEIFRSSAAPREGPPRDADLETAD